MSKHMTLSERKDIEILLKEGKSFKEIGGSLGKDCTTISKEIRYHFIERKSGAWGQAYNACTIRFGCKKPLLCSNQDCGRKKCNFCSICNNFCDSFIEEKCRKLDKPIRNAFLLFLRPKMECFFDDITRKLILVPNNFSLFRNISHILITKVYFRLIVFKIQYRSRNISLNFI